MLLPPREEEKRYCLTTPNIPSNNFLCQGRLQEQQGTMLAISMGGLPFLQGS